MTAPVRMYRLWLGPGRESQPMTLLELLAVCRASTPTAHSAARGAA